MTRYLLITAGTISVTLGVLGIFLPLLPTTPFMLLAAACYARSSPRFYAWLLNHRIFGPPIRSWRANRTIPARSKKVAYTSVAVMMATSITFAPILWVKLMLACLTIFLFTMLYRVPTTESLVSDVEG